MADDIEAGEKKPSKLRTFLWAAATVVPFLLLPSGPIWGILKIGAAIFAGSKAWGSHKENQALEAEARTPRDVTPENSLSMQQQRAATIERMQAGVDQTETTNWRTGAQRGTVKISR